MKKLMLAVALLVGACWKAQAASESDLQVAQLSESYFVLRASGSYADCMELGYTGTGSTEAVATVSSKTFIAYIQDGAGALAEDWGVSLAASGYDTMGEFCTYVEGLANYTCKLEGCPEEWNSNRLRDQTATSGTNNMKANHKWHVQLDTGPAFDGGDNTRTASLAVGRTPDKGKRLSVLSCNALINAVGETGKIAVYGKPKSHEGNGESYSTAYKVWQGYASDEIAVSSPSFTVNGVGGFDFALNAHVAVTAGNQEAEQTSAAVSLQARTNYLECLFRER